jgi:hypothetical protein
MLLPDRKWTGLLPSLGKYKANERGSRTPTVPKWVRCRRRLVRCLESLTSFFAGCPSDCIFARGSIPSSFLFFIFAVPAFAREVHKVWCRRHVDACGRLRGITSSTASQQPGFLPDFELEFIGIIGSKVGTKWRRWINLVLEGQPELPKRPALRWPFRPSNFLILLGAGFYTYWGLYEPCPAPRFPFFCGVIVTVLAFVFRRWEDGSVREQH